MILETDFGFASGEVTLNRSLVFPAFRKKSLITLFLDLPGRRSPRFCCALCPFALTRILMPEAVTAPLFSTETLKKAHFR